MVESLIPTVPATKESSNTAKSAAAGSLKNQREGASTTSFAYSREDLEVRYTSKDGDVLEMRRTTVTAAGYSRGSACASPKGDCGVEAHEAGKTGEARGPLKVGPGGGLEGMAEWVREVRAELEAQQARLVEALLKGGEEGEPTDARFAMFKLTLTAEGMGLQADLGAMDEEYGVPEYWNAENTSDRIVNFATSFAGIVGNDPEFAETMVNAVAEGFRQAGEIMGTLPGKAGKLNRDTHDLVFEKLGNWLEAWKSGAYNQEAQNKALDPALAA
jgi:hypothetical protein